MPRISKAAIIIVPALLLLAAAAVMHIFALNFEKGNLYPPYSSLRSDPLGTRGLHDSLVNLKSVDVERNYYSFDRMQEDPPSVFLVSGAPSKGMLMGRKRIAEKLGALAMKGDRVVVTFSIIGKWEPIEDEEDLEDSKESKEQGEKEAETENAPSESVLQKPQQDDKALSGSKDLELEPLEPEFTDEEHVPPANEEKAVIKSSEEDEPSKLEQAVGDEDSGEEAAVKETSEEEDSKDDGEEKEISPRVEKIRDYLNLHDIASGKENWGLSMNQNPDFVFGDSQAILSLEYADSGLAPNVSWYSSWFFEDISPKWRVIYTYQDKPVMVERDFGRGSLVFCTDSYFLSNESLAEKPSTELLVWLFKPYDRVVFDEWHLGIAKQEGISTLARKYGLAGAGLALLIWALLYVWHNAAPLVPRKSEEPSKGANGEHISSRGYAEAMASLLRRNITNEEVLRHCFLLWENSAKNDKDLPKELQEKVQLAVLSPGKASVKEVVEAYNRAVDILARER
ncbi:DUF4350 domain-containing protein [Desulfatibacillum aliphaticivorans]|uniref:DUF4350 domain-containing protein n=1 Tax=Desulfatibacillum aliphaticivorans TaxID=218208 RepID=UPI00040997FE|nr:DUF4350 domain-containing protein [Desulfatibacillum aliphaticivorans]